MNMITVHRGNPIWPCDGESSACVTAMEWAVFRCNDMKLLDHSASPVTFAATPTSMWSSAMTEATGGIWFATSYFTVPNKIKANYLLIFRETVTSGTWIKVRDQLLVDDTRGPGFLVQTVLNETYLEEVSADVWKLRIRSEADDKDILRKHLKDYQGNAMSDLTAGKLGREDANEATFPAE